MKKSGIKIKIGDILQMEGDKSYYIVTEKRGSLFEYREISRITNKIIISGVCHSAINEDLDDYNESMHEANISGVSRLYRFDPKVTCLDDCGIVGNAYDMLTYGIDQFCIFNAYENEKDN